MFVLGTQPETVFVSGTQHKQKRSQKPNINRIPPARIRTHIGLVGICVESKEFALGLWKFSLGLQGFLDTHLFILATENACVWSLNQCNGTKRMGSHSGRTWALKLQSLIKGFRAVSFDLIFLLKICDL